MILGGINVIITTCKYIDDSITSNGDLSSLKDLITENLGKYIGYLLRLLSKLVYNYSVRM